VRTGLLRGLLIGVLGGIFTGPTMFIWLMVYSVVRPEKHLGSTAVLGPITGGLASSILGIVLGAVAGAVVGLIGVRLTGLRRCVLFGLILMAFIGTLGAFIDYFSSPQRFAVWFAAVIGMDVVCPILAGIVGGALVGTLTNDR
jgi:hypothetical protein